MNAELRAYLKAAIDRAVRAGLPAGELALLDRAAERRREREWKRARVARMTEDERDRMRERDRLSRRRRRAAAREAA